MNEVIVTVPLEVASFESKIQLQKAAALVAAGGIVAVHAHGLGGIIANGESINSLRLVAKVKGRHKYRAAMLHTATLRDYGIIDADALHPDLKDLFTNQPHVFSQRVGNMAHIQYPIHHHRVADVPNAMQSFDVASGFHIFQNFDPSGNRVESLVCELYAQGVRYPMITSLNISSQPTIKDSDKALEFCMASGAIPIFITDHSTSERTMYAIIHGLNLRVVRGDQEVVQKLYPAANVS